MTDNNQSQSSFLSSIVSKNKFLETVRFLNTSVTASAHPVSRVEYIDGKKKVFGYHKTVDVTQKDQETALIDLLYSHAFRLHRGDNASQTVIIENNYIVTDTVSVGIEGWVSVGKIWQEFFKAIKANSELTKTWEALCRVNKNKKSTEADFNNAYADFVGKAKGVTLSLNNTNMTLAHVYESITNELGADKLLEIVLQEGDGHRDNCGYRIVDGKLTSARIDFDYSAQRYRALLDGKVKGSEALLLPMTGDFLDNFWRVHETDSNIRFQPLRKSSPINIAGNQIRSGQKGKVAKATLNTGYDLFRYLKNRRNATGNQIGRLGEAYNVTLPQEAELMQIAVRAKKADYEQDMWLTALNFVLVDFSLIKENFDLMRQKFPQHEIVGNEVYQLFLANYEHRQTELRTALLTSKSFLDFLKKDDSREIIEASLNKHAKRLNLLVDNVPNPLLENLTQFTDSILPSASPDTELSLMKARACFKNTYTENSIEHNIQAEFNQQISDIISVEYLGIMNKGAEREQHLALMNLNINQAKVHFQLVLNLLSDRTYTEPEKEFVKQFIKIQFKPNQEGNKGNLEFVCQQIIALHQRLQVDVNQHVNSTIAADSATKVTTELVEETVAQQSDRKKINKELQKIRVQLNLASDNNLSPVLDELTKQIPPVVVLESEFNRRVGMLQALAVSRSHITTEPQTILAQLVPVLVRVGEESHFNLDEKKQRCLDILQAYLDPNGSASQKFRYKQLKQTEFSHFKEAIEQAKDVNKLENIIFNLEKVINCNYKDKITQAKLAQLRKTLSLAQAGASQKKKVVFNFAGTGQVPMAGGDAHELYCYDVLKDPDALLYVFPGVGIPDSGFGSKSDHPKLDGVLATSFIIRLEEAMSLAQQQINKGTEEIVVMGHSRGGVSAIVLGKLLGHFYPGKVSVVSHDPVPGEFALYPYLDGRIDLLSLIPSTHPRYKDLQANVLSNKAYRYPTLREVLYSDKYKPENLFVTYHTQDTRADKFALLGDNCTKDEKKNIFSAANPAIVLALRGFHNTGLSPAKGVNGDVQILFSWISVKASALLNSARFKSRNIQMQKEGEPDPYRDKMKEVLFLAYQEVLKEFMTAGTDRNRRNSVFQEKMNTKIIEKLIKQNLNDTHAFQNPDYHAFQEKMLREVPVFLSDMFLKNIQISDLSQNNSPGDIIPYEKLHVFVKEHCRDNQLKKDSSVQAIKTKKEDILPALSEAVQYLYGKENSEPDLQADLNIEILHQCLTSGRPLFRGVLGNTKELKKVERLHGKILRKPTDENLDKLIQALLDCSPEFKKSYDHKSDIYRTGNVDEVRQQQCHEALRAFITSGVTYEIPLTNEDFNKYQKTLPARISSKGLFFTKNQSDSLLKNKKDTLQITAPSPLKKK